MQFKTSKDTDLLKDTFYQDSINISYEELVKLFGEPLIYGEEENSKTRAEWIIEWEDGGITTIYDWKSEYIPVEDVVDWHVGGVNNKAAEYLHDYFKLMIIENN